jgi:hypothetical protein
MIARRLIAAALLLGASASAHRLDEYLQATLFSVEQDHIQAQMRLVPGVAVAYFILGGIDTNGDGILSGAEQQAYGERVLNDVLLTMDGKFLTPTLTSIAFPSLEEMKEGVGEIRLEFSAGLPRGGPNRRLVFENRHHSRISAYLVNCLVSTDRNIRIGTQIRNEDQSFYQLDYVQAGVASSGLSSGLQPRGWLGAGALVLAAGIVFLWRRRTSRGTAGAESLDERKNVGVDPVRVGCGHSVRKSRIDLQRRIL